MAMATAGELHRAADFLEFARQIRHGKRRQRAASRHQQGQRIGTPRPR
jgi:hypothetical protein